MFEIMENLIDFMLAIFADDIEMVTKYHEQEAITESTFYTVEKTITVQDPDVFKLLRNKTITRIAHKIKADYYTDFAITQNINELIIYYSNDTDKDFKFTLKCVD